MHMSIRYSWCVASLACLFLVGCASNEGFDRHYDGSLEPFGFFSGIFQGYVVPFVIVINIVLFFISIFFEAHVHFPLIGTPNTGFGYFIGFVIGIGSHSGEVAAVKNR